MDITKMFDFKNDTPEQIAEKINDNIDKFTVRDIGFLYRSFSLNDCPIHFEANDGKTICVAGE